MVAFTTPFLFGEGKNGDCPLTGVRIFESVRKNVPRFGRGSVSVVCQMVIDVNCQSLIAKFNVTVALEREISSGGCVDRLMLLNSIMLFDAFFSR